MDDAAGGHRTRPPSAPHVRVVAVVVAYNRRDLLAQALDALAAQRRPVDAILVVDNASTDDSAALARAHPVAPEVLSLDRNTGGAGGFAAGIARAVGPMAADAVWLMDDDTIPTPTALGALLDAVARYPGPVAVAGSRVVWTDGRDHPMNTPRRRPLASRRELADAETVHARPVRSSSFVSMLVSADAVRRLGLPIADYFIWNDDFEYSCRLLRDGTGLYVPASVVEHRTRVFGGSDADPGERFYYEVRNKIWMLTRSRALTLLERVIYGGATLRRWARLLLRSHQRPVLVAAARRGLRDARRPPRPTADLLDEVGVDPSLRGSPVTATDPAAPLPFSLLLPVYRGDHAAFLRRAYDSATIEQTRRPDEVVIVQDGPVGAELQAELADIGRRSCVPVRVIALPENRGLACALTEGLAACRHDVVARADADDISMPHRFATQLPLVESGADLVGSSLVEFDGDESVTGVVRVMPTEPDEIARRARFADPFNHPTVVYRRDAVQAAGGYQDLRLMEDYLLFARMIERGAVARNVAEPLLKYRVGAGAYDRRGGAQLLRSELELQRIMRREGFTTGIQYARNVLIRGGYRLVPVPLRRWAYRSLVVSRRGQGRSPGAAR